MKIHGTREAVEFVGESHRWSSLETAVPSRLSTGSPSSACVLARPLSMQVDSDGAACCQDVNHLARPLPTGPIHENTLVVCCVHMLLRNESNELSQPCALRSSTDDLARGAAMDFRRWKVNQCGITTLEGPRNDNGR